MTVVLQQRILPRIDRLAELDGGGRGLAEERQGAAQPEARLGELRPCRDGAPEQSFGLAKLRSIGAEAE